MCQGSKARLSSRLEMALALLECEEDEEEDGGGWDKMRRRTTRRTLTLQLVDQRLQRIME